MYFVIIFQVISKFFLNKNLQSYQVPFEQKMDHFNYCTLGASKSGIEGRIFSATQFCQVSHHFPMIFIKTFMIFPGVLSFFQVFHVEWEPRL